jgi:ABC-type histidine transport system ATPase subunit
LTELNKEGRTIVVVTHSLELAKKYAHTVYWLKDGKIEKITRERKKS